MSDNKRENDLDLSAQLESLPAEMTPKRDLWPGIEQAIASRPQLSTAANDSHWHNWARTAAAFVPAAFLLVFWLQTSPDVTTQSESVRALSAGFELQKRQLLRHVSMEASAVNDWQTSLEELEQAEDAIEKALQSQPEDPALLKMLSQIYQQQLALIQKASDTQSSIQFSQI
jgi:hypothetical protein